MCEELIFQKCICFCQYYLQSKSMPELIFSNKYLSCQSSSLLLLEVCKNHSKKENISVGGSDQRRVALFWIHLKETRLNIFVLLLVALNFSTFIFSIGTKLFIRHPVVLFGILMLLEQFDDFVQLPLWCILKDRQLCLHKYLIYWVLYPIIA